VHESEQRVVGEQRRQRVSVLERQQAGLVAEQTVTEELGQTLPVDLRAVAAALVQFVHYPPGTATVECCRVAVDETEVRIAQAVLALRSCPIRASSSDAASRRAAASSSSWVPRR
jgi:hypothetical protein